MSVTIGEHYLVNIINPICIDAGFDLVRVKLSGSSSPILQIMAEPLENRGMTVTDCATLSRRISAIFEEDDPINGAYNLEVSSPGLDRPLTKTTDFDRFKGYDARVELKQPLDGRRRFKGRIVGYQPEADPQGLLTLELELDQDGETPDQKNTVDLPVNQIERAKIEINDHLLTQAEEGLFPPPRTA